VFGESLLGIYPTGFIEVNFLAFHDPFDFELSGLV